MRRLLIALLLISLYSCHSDKERYYFFDKYDSMDMGDGRDTFIYKSKQRNIYDKIIIYSDIIKYGEDKAYIIALQRPNEELMLKLLEDKLGVYYSYHEDENEKMRFPHGSMTNKDLKKSLDSLVSNTKDSTEAYQIEAEKIFKKEPFYQKVFQNELNYYIIDKKVDSVFGPLKYDEFERLKQKKNINVKFGDILFWDW